MGEAHVKATFEALYAAVQPLVDESGQAALRLALRTAARALLREPQAAAPSTPAEDAAVRWSVAVSGSRVSADFEDVHAEYGVARTALPKGEATVARTAAAHPTTVAWRRYRDFDALWNALRRRGRFVPTLPPKRLRATSADTACVLARGRALRRWLQIIVASPALRRTQAFRRFCDDKVAAFADDDAADDADDDSKDDGGAGRFSEAPRVSWASWVDASARPSWTDARPSFAPRLPSPAAAQLLREQASLGGARHALEALLRATLALQAASARAADAGRSRADALEALARCVDRGSRGGEQLQDVAHTAAPLRGVQLASAAAQGDGTAASDALRDVADALKFHVDVATLAAKTHAPARGDRAHEGDHSDKAAEDLSAVRRARGAAVVGAFAALGAAWARDARVAREAWGMLGDAVSATTPAANAATHKAAVHTPAPAAHKANAAARTPAPANAAARTPVPSSARWGTPAEDDRRRRRRPDGNASGSPTSPPNFSDEDEDGDGKDYAAAVQGVQHRGVRNAPAAPRVSFERVARPRRGSVQPRDAAPRPAAPERPISRQTRSVPPAPLDDVRAHARHSDDRPIEPHPPPQHQQTSAPFIPTMPSSDDAKDPPPPPPKRSPSMRSPSMRPPPAATRLPAAARPPPAAQPEPPGSPQWRTESCATESSRRQPRDWRTAPKASRNQSLPPAPLQPALRSDAQRVRAWRNGRALSDVLCDLAALIPDAPAISAPLPPSKVRAAYLTAARFLHPDKIHRNANDVGLRTEAFLLLKDLYETENARLAEPRDA
ncbi:hypothetical protein M885DRAFT_612546 [Pelagophyceae sp. CCMP2097]|nr:hypothetical protein M885DRAFT_612546 [Pelagophyceae sp. CCMP2097]